MIKPIYILFCLFVSSMSFSQKNQDKKVDTTLSKSNGIDFFDFSVFKPKTKDLTFYNASIKETTSTKMPVFVAKGNYKLRIIIPDSLKKYSLRILKPE